MVVESGFRPDLILSIARGGLFIAGSLGYALSTKNIFVMNVEYYTDIDERHDVPVVLPPYLELVDLDDAKMLMPTTWLTPATPWRWCVTSAPPRSARVRTAVLYEKSRSLVKCDHVWRRTDLWIDFPWSSEPPLIGGGPAH